MVNWQDKMKVAVFDPEGEVECIGEIFYCMPRSRVIEARPLYGVSFDKKTGMSKCGRKIEPYDPTKHKVSRRNELLPKIRSINWHLLPVEVLEKVIAIAKPADTEANGRVEG